MAGNLAGTLMLAVAAHAPARPLRVRRTDASWLPAPRSAPPCSRSRSRSRAPGRSARDRRPALAAFHPELGRAIVQCAIAVTLVIAAVGLARRAGRLSEPLLRWVAIAVVLGGIAKLDYALFPPLGPENVHLGDALRVAGWIALFAGVLEEMRRRMRARAEAAVARERRRLARELHDGVAQELAFIRRRAGRLSELDGGVEILDAADRALEDSRRAIEALVPPAHEPLDVALERLGARLATECEIEVQVNVRERVEVTPEVRAELIRIISEAVRNAARHGGARHVWVELAGTPLSVRVVRRRPRLPRRRQQRPGRRRLRPDRDARAGRAGGREVQLRVRPRRRYPRAGGAAIDPVRVLLADDHAPTREDIAAALGQDGGFDVIATAEDAPGAVDAALREQPDLALLDVNMPGSGLAAAWEITARLPSTRVVMLTISRDDCTSSRRCGRARRATCSRTPRPSGCRTRCGT